MIYQVEKIHIKLMLNKSHDNFYSERSPEKIRNSQGSIVQIRPEQGLLQSSYVWMNLPIRFASADYSMIVIVADVFFTWAASSVVRTTTTHFSSLTALAGMVMVVEAAPLLSVSPSAATLKLSPSIPNW